LQKAAHNCGWALLRLATVCSGSVMFTFAKKGWFPCPRSPDWMSSEENSGAAAAAIFFLAAPGLFIWATTTEQPSSSPHRAEPTHRVGSSGCCCSSSSFRCCCCSAWEPKNHEGGLGEAWEHLPASSHFLVFPRPASPMQNLSLLSWLPPARRLAGCARRPVPGVCRPAATCGTASVGGWGGQWGGFLGEVAGSGPPEGVREGFCGVVAGCGSLCGLLGEGKCFLVGLGAGPAWGGGGVILARSAAE